MPEDSKGLEPEDYEESEEETVEDGVIHGRLSALLPRCTGDAHACARCARFLSRSAYKPAVRPHPSAQALTRLRHAARRAPPQEAV